MPGPHSGSQPRHKDGLRESTKLSESYVSEKGTGDGQPALTPYCFLMGGCRSLSYNQPGCLVTSLDSFLSLGGSAPMTTDKQLFTSHPEVFNVQSKGVKDSSQLEIGSLGGESYKNSSRPPGTPHKPSARGGSCRWPRLWGHCCGFSCLVRGVL